jgi:hypothetical protein
VALTELTTTRREAKSLDFFKAVETKPVKQVPPPSPASFGSVRRSRVIVGEGIIGITADKKKE